MIFFFFLSLSSEASQRLLTRLVMQSAMYLTFDSSAVTGMNGNALLALMFHGELITRDDLVQFLASVPSLTNLTPTAITDGLGADSSFALNATKLLTANATNSSTGLANLTYVSDFDQFMGDVSDFFIAFGEVLADIIQQLGEILLDPKPTAEFVVITLFCLIFIVAGICLGWTLVKAFIRLWCWCYRSCGQLCCCPDHSASVSASDMDIELAGLDRALAQVAQAQDALHIEVELPVDPLGPAPLALPEEEVNFQPMPDFIPPPPPPPPPSPAAPLGVAL